jgi:hypothetical protein
VVGYHRLGCGRRNRLRGRGWGAVDWGAVNATGQDAVGVRGGGP